MENCTRAICGIMQLWKMEAGVNEFRRLDDETTSNGGIDRLVLHCLDRLAGGQTA
jgi:hypothetical protein